MKGLVLGGVSSGVGKTLVSLILIRKLVDQGLSVQPFKVGPDYIDPSFHETVSGRPRRNLDWWMMGSSGVRENFSKGMEGVDVGIVEGVMGLFDGLGDRGFSSTYHIAEILDLDIVLVVDAKAMAQSAEALISGFKALSRGRVKGVVFNRVGGEGHRDILFRAAERAGVLVCGMIPFSQELKLPERHLGLFMSHEVDTGFFEKLKDFTELLEWDAIKGILKPARIEDGGEFPLEGRFKGIRIAFARDNCFSFYYTESLEALNQSGCQVLFFSPLEDPLPEADALIIPGGYPELYGGRLKKETMEEVKSFKGPIYAECGGLIYLSKEVLFQGKRIEMAGLFDITVSFEKKPRLGYVLGIPTVENPFTKRPVKGHMFHYSFISHDWERWGYRVILPKKRSYLKEGLVKGKVLATYLHTNLYYSPDLLKGFLELSTYNFHL